MKKHGFSLDHEATLSEIGGQARLWRHEATGAELLSICNGDENKCFGVTFRTPPTDSTGVAHILEHSVLCGSRKYPLREPFVELLKGSLQTFLNAFTFPDKTCYPVASANLRDFYNLMDVYLDAVFHPCLGEHIFRQEGWHVHASAPEGPFAYKGVVFSEMKGVYSSPDSVLAEKSQQAVFPDTLYSLDSGGNPECIPDLTYQTFCDFHRRHYHPTNARFFFWGDDPEDERLRRIDEALAGFARREPESLVPLQDHLDAPRVLELPYAAADSETRALFTVNWLLGERGDIDSALLMEMLEHILEGLPGSPLRKALIESGLGEDTTGCGLETDLRQMYYSTGLKGVDPANVQQAELLIFEVLTRLAENGIGGEAVEAAVNSVEFAYREANSGRFPRGLAAMLQSLSTWLYGGDPLAPLAWEKPLAEIKARLAAGEKVFENAIRQNLLENRHRVTVTLLPDARLKNLREEEEKARLDRNMADAGPQGRQQVVDETELLAKIQATPDSPEALATIPALTPADLPPRNRPVPCEESSLPQTCLYHDLPTAGIAYVNVLLPIESLPPGGAALLPLLARSVTELGSARHDFSQLGALMAAKTGGVGAQILSGQKLGGGTFAWLCLGGKAVYDKIDDLFAIFHEVLLEPLKNPDVIALRLGQMLLEAKARLEYALQAAGNATVSTRLAAHFSGAGAMGEIMGGLSHLTAVRQQIDRLENAPETLLADLAALRAAIVCADGALLDCTAEPRGFARARELACKLFGELPKTRKTKFSWEQVAGMQPLAALPRDEAIVAPSLINYVGKAANLYAAGYEYSGSANVILRYLRMGRLWEKVRVSGGAYGVGCQLSRMTGVFTCASYRDPGVESTLAVYDGLGEYLLAESPDKARVAQAIVGAVGDLDSYLLPDARGFQSLLRHLSGLTEEMRQQTREQMLATSSADFTAFAGALQAFAQKGEICVLGGDQARAAAATGGWACSDLI